MLNVQYYQLWAHKSMAIGQVVRYYFIDTGCCVLVSKWVLLTQTSSKCMWSTCEFSAVSSDIIIIIIKIVHKVQNKTHKNNKSKRNTLGYSVQLCSTGFSFLKSFLNGPVWSESNSKLNEIGSLLTVLNVLTFCNFSDIKLLIWIIWCAAHWMLNHSMTSVLLLLDHRMTELAFWT